MGVLYCLTPLLTVCRSDRRGRDRMVVEFTTYAEEYWIQHYVIKFVSDLQAVGRSVILIRSAKPWRSVISWRPVM